MSESESGEISLFAAAITLLRAWRRIAVWTIVGAAVAAALALFKAPMFLATSSFVPQANDANRSGLAGLAGQFGVTLPATSQSLSSDFYAKLLQSPVLLRRIARDTFVVSEQDGQRAALADLFKVPAGDPARREEQGAKALMKVVAVSVVKTTGVVEIAVVTRWRSVSLAITTELVKALNEFNQVTRQSQATAERKFVEGRLAAAGADLRSAEDSLARFLQQNRQWTTSAELTLQHDRLQRRVSMRQQVFTTLTQSYEEVRLREVRDTPVITMIEAPTARIMPEPRGRVMMVLIGGLIGAGFGILLVAIAAQLRREREAGGGAATDFAAALRVTGREIATASRGPFGRRST